MRKLSNAQISKIVRLRIKGMKLGEIASRFKIHPSYVHKLYSGYSKAARSSEMPAALRRLALNRLLHQARLKVRAIQQQIDELNRAEAS